MLACAVRKKYFAWLCNPSAGSLSYNTRVTTSHRARARAGAEAAVSRVWQSDCQSRSGSRTVGVGLAVGLTRSRTGPSPVGAGAAEQCWTRVRSHTPAAARARIGVLKRGRGPGSTPHFIFTVTPITSANNGAMPRTDTTHQHAGRGARHEMAEPARRQSAEKADEQTM